MRGGEVFAWHSFGDRLEIDSMPDGALRVQLDDDGIDGSLILPTGAVDQLVTALVEHSPPAELAEAREALAATEQQLGEAERDRDAALERATAAEAALRETLVQLETAKTALALADDRQRAHERYVDRAGRVHTL